MRCKSHVYEMSRWLRRAALLVREGTSITTIWLGRFVRALSMDTISGGHDIKKTEAQPFHHCLWNFGYCRRGRTKKRRTANHTFWEVIIQWSTLFHFIALLKIKAESNLVIQALYWKINLIDVGRQISMLMHQERLLHRHYFTFWLNSLNLAINSINCLWLSLLCGEANRFSIQTYLLIKWGFAFILFLASRENSALWVLSRIWGSYKVYNIVLHIQLAKSISKT